MVPVKEGNEASQRERKGCRGEVSQLHIGNEGIAVKDGVKERLVGRVTLVVCSKTGRECSQE